MQAGRDLDALIAEKVMGLRVEPCRKIGEPRAIANEHGHFERFIPHYSTDIADAWEVVEKLHMQADEEGDVILSINVSKERVGYRCEILCFEAAYVHDADTAPLAICLAALAAVGR